MNLHPIVLFLLLHKATSSPISQLSDFEGPSPIENKDDDSESFINVLHIEETPAPVTVPNDIVNDITNDQEAEDTQVGTDIPLRIGVTIETNVNEVKEEGRSNSGSEESVFESTTYLIDTTEEINTQTTENEDFTTEASKNEETMSMADVLTTERTVNIEFKENSLPEEATTTILPTVRNLEIISETTTEPFKVESRYNEDLDTIQSVSDNLINTQPTTPEAKESTTEGLQPAVFNGVFSIGRSDFDTKSTSSTSPKPGSFGSVFINLAKKYDSRYKYKYSWSFSGLEKTTPKTKEPEGRLFNEEFLARLKSTTPETIRLDTINLGATGSIIRDNSRTIAEYKGINLHNPSFGSYL